MKLTQLSAVAGILLSCISMNTMANTESPHRVGLDLLGGNAKYKGKSGDVAIGASYLYYNYQFNKDFAFELGLQGGEEIDDWSCTELSDDEWRCLNKSKPMFDFNANHLDFSSIVTALKWQLATSKNNSFYAKAGIQFYDYDFSRNKTQLVEDDGVGIVLGAGWQYQWDNGIGINAGLVYQTMGDLKPQDMLNFGISYHF
ncbi:outer membrane beta-barrel protein [Thalassotalea ganghwensis]